MFVFTFSFVNYIHLLVNGSFQHACNIFHIISVTLISLKQWSFWLFKASILTLNLIMNICWVIKWLAHTRNVILLLWFSPCIDKVMQIVVLYPYAYVSVLQAVWGECLLIWIDSKRNRVDSICMYVSSKWATVITYTNLHDKIHLLVFW
jgi:hypothetical protein